jgi:putative transposase
MSRKANCRDNASSESLFNSEKAERVHGSGYDPRDEARGNLFAWVDVYYKSSGRQFALGGEGPAAVYAAWLNMPFEPRLAA